MENYILKLKKKEFGHKILLNASINEQTAYNYKKTIRQLIQALISHEVGILADKITGDTSERVHEFLVNIHEKKVVNQILESYTKFAEASTSVFFNDNHSTVVYKNRRLVFVLEEFVQKIDIYSAYNRSTIIIPSKMNTNE